MARRRRTSTFEDLIEISSRLPWWVSCLLALISFLVLHVIASIEVTPPSDLKDISTPLFVVMLGTLATFGQFLLPLAFFFGAFASLLGQLNRRKNYLKVENYEPPNPLYAISWQDFEGVVSEFFRQRDYVVSLTGGGGPDGGVDIVLSKGNDKYLVQCKQWKAYKVGVQIVRELYGVMAASGAAGGFVVTAGEFTPDAIAFAKGLNINLFNGSRLQEMIREKKTAAALEAEELKSNVVLPLIPRCPKCGESLVLRTAKKGKNAGQQFWGCSRFPHCRGTRPL
jgi:restriction system protein